MMNDILDLSKIEASGVHLDLCPVHLHDAVERTVEQFRADAEDKGLHLIFESCTDVPEYVRGDARRMGQVIGNLVGNAVKFTSRGEVRVRLSRTTPGMVTIEVSDTGIGIPENARETLFDPFTQADSSVTRRFGGTGLGLAISREIARAMTGSIELVASSPNGSTFRFMFRAEACESAEEPSPEEMAAARLAEEDAVLRGAEVLVAEDNPMNQVIARRLLKKLGANPTVVDDGRQAVDAVAKRPYDLVLMDLMMPNLAGTEATVEIRGLDRPWSDLPIVAFTAGAFEHDREDAAAAGMDGFLEKPVRLPELRATLLEQLSSDAHAARRGA
jgi:CheY-like chemotaxis protein